MVAAAPARSVTQPVKPPMPLIPRPGDKPAGAPAADAADAPQQSEPNPVEAGTLIVGHGISFVGDIAACHRLVVNGIVEATLQRCENVVVGEKGFFKGNARTENAEVSGRIEGDLVVRKRLLIHTAGQVSGTTTYGEIEIERGGRIVGQAEAREGAQHGRDW